MRFIESEAKSMRADLKKALAIIEEKYNARLTVGNISYGNGLQVKISFGKLVEGANGTFAATKEATEFVRRAERMGLSKDILGEELEFEGQIYVITGYNTRASKRPINFTIDGSNYSADETYMHRFVKGSRPEYYL